MIRALTMAAAAALLLWSMSAQAAGQAELAKGMKPQNYKTFLKACTKAGLLENCEFLKAVDDYKAQRDPVKKSRLAAMILEGFILPDSTRQVNLPSSLVEKTKAAYAAAKKSKKFTNALFDPAREEIAKLLVDNFAGHARHFDPAFAAMK